MGEQNEAEELEAKLRTMQQQRLALCKAEVDAVLAKHKCVLIGVPQLVPAGNGAWVIQAEAGIALAKEQAQ